MRLFVTAQLAVAALLILAPIEAGATTLLYMDVEALSENADAVIVGTVEETRPAWNAEHTRIYTHTLIRIDDVIAGDVHEDEVIHVVHVGGRVGDDEMVMAGVPEYENGERVALFVEERHRGTDGKRVEDHYLVTGMFQGKFRVTEEAGKTLVSQPARVLGTQLVAPKDTLATPRATQMELTELTRRVRAVRKEVRR